MVVLCHRFYRKVVLGDWRDAREYLPHLIKLTKQQRRGAGYDVKP
ncbi:hypothetical protein XBJ1_1770 [Xenorhabdus bovienii SS-2004]|uniref:Uncharacterized protein n=1 Tax=Xenorhabdus bovienii (strain SS-2004) TaxID=406818 RepID=D3V2D1_XENBS|nr:hypothetical protein XBJ1_1770 [Xenorhabdus bovienii SS-2004]